MGIVRFNKPVINVSDIERSVAFYRELGMSVVVRAPSPSRAPKSLEKTMGVSDLDIRVAVLDAPGEGAGREIEFLQWLSPKPSAPPAKRNVYGANVAWCAFQVEGLKELYNKLKSEGVEFLGLLEEGEGRGHCYARDPDGYIVELGGTL